MQTVIFNTSLTILVYFIFANSWGGEKSLSTILAVNIVNIHKFLFNVSLSVLQLPKLIIIIIITQLLKKYLY